jgi:hypothetical protein
VTTNDHVPVLDAENKSTPDTLKDILVFSDAGLFDQIL